MSLFKVWGPDGLTISGELFTTPQQAVLEAARFVAQYQRQGYYRDNQMNMLTLPELAETLRVEELDTRMTAEKAYVTYIQDNLDRIGADWQPVCFAEFLESEECMNYMAVDPSLEEVTAPDALTVKDYEEVMESHRQLVRELDVLLNGEQGAAKQASLCDIVCQVRHEMLVGKLVRIDNPLTPPTSVFSETEMIELLEFARIALEDGEFFDRMCYDTDLEDEYMIALRDKLQEVMASNEKVFDPQ